MSQRTDAAISRNIKIALAAQLSPEDLDLLLRRYKAPTLRAGIVAFVRELADPFPDVEDDEAEELEEDLEAAEPTE